MEIVVAKRTRRKGTLARRPPKKRVNKPKVKSLSKLKRELDSAFSIWVRTGAKECFTCGGAGTEKTLQCGHFVPRQYLATRWEPDNCRPQCVGCNIWGKGKILDFEEHLIREIGAERVQALKDKRKELWKLDRAFYDTHIQKYQSLLEHELK